MPEYHYNTDQFLPITIEKAWNFFSAAKNLAVITPPELDFKILSKLDDKEIFEGMLIEYRVKPLLGIPLNWKTEIESVKKPGSFKDKQLKGPYKTWEHTHTFQEQENGVLMKDAVKYELPFGLIGQLAHALFIRKKIEHIFSFRKKILNKIFIENGNLN